MQNSFPFLAEEPMQVSDFLKTGQGNGRDPWRYLAQGVED